MGRGYAAKPDSKASKAGREPQDGFVGLLKMRAIAAGEPDDFKFHSANSCPVALAAIDEVL